MYILPPNYPKTKIWGEAPPKWNRVKHKNEFVIKQLLSNATTYMGFRFEVDPWPSS